MLRLMPGLPIAADANTSTEASSLPVRAALPRVILQCGVGTQDLRQ